jgi:PAS domain S-box-containing protein
VESPPPPAGQAAAPPEVPFETVASSLGSPALVFDSKGVVRAINSAAEHLLGVTKENLAGQCVELTNSLYMSLEFRAHRDRSLFEQVQPWSGDWFKVHASGSEVPTRAHVLPIGQTGCFLEILEATEAASSESNAEKAILTSLIELAPVGLAVTDGQGHIAYANPEFEHRLHRGRAVRPGTPLSRFFTAEDYPRLFGRTTGAVSLAREPACAQVPDGQLRRVRVSARSPLPAGSSPPFLLVALEDVSELEGAQEDASLFMEASRHLSEALIFSDPQGTVFFANEPALTLFERAEDELTGKPVESLLGQGALERAALAGGPASLELQLQLKRRRFHRTVKVFPVLGRAGKQLAWGWVVPPARSGGRSRRVKPADRKPGR